MTATAAPLPETASTEVELREWWLTYNRGYVDDVRSILDRLGITEANVAEVADAIQVAVNEPLIRAAMARYGLSPTAS